MYSTCRQWIGEKYIAWGVLTDIKQHEHSRLNVWLTSSDQDKPCSRLRSVFALRSNWEESILDELLGKSIDSFQKLLFFLEKHSQAHMDPAVDYSRIRHDIHSGTELVSKFYAKLKRGEGTYQQR